MEIRINQFVAIILTALALIPGGGHALMPCAAAPAAITCVTLAIFFTWTLPANRATTNWTAPPPEWQVLRIRWECSHAVNAALNFVALCATTASALLSGRADARYDRTNL
nr:hypothetical protein [uncultured Rhodopila sp.]